MREEEIVKDFTKLVKRISLINRFSVVITGISASLWMWVLGIIEFLGNGTTNWLVLAIISLIISFAVIYVISDHANSKLISLYRFLSLILLFNSNFVFTNILSISLSIFVVSILLNMSLDTLQSRIQRTHILSQTYKFDNTVYQTLLGNYKYINERLDWILKNHVIIFILSLTLLLLVNIFSTIQVIMDSIFVQYAALGALIISFILLVVKFYIPIDKKVKDEYKTAN